MKRLNVRVLVVLVAIVAAVAVGSVALNRVQVARNAGALAARAREKRAEGKTDEAMRLLAKYTGLRPTDTKAYAEFAELLLERANGPAPTRTDISRAFTAMETAVRRDPENVALRMKLAEFDLRIGRFGDAREHLDAIRQRLEAGDKPDGDEAQVSATAVEVLRARAYAGVGDYAAAAAAASDLIGFDLDKKAFDDSAKAPPGTTDAYLVLAAILEEKLKDPASASRVIEQLVTANAKEPRAWISVGRWHRQRGDLDKAGEALARAVELAPDDIDTVLLEFDLAVAGKAAERAAATLARGLEKFPDDERLYRAKAVLEMQANDRDKALETLRLGLEKLPKRPGLLLMLADVLIQEDAIPEASDMIRELATVLGPANPMVGLLEARILLQQQKWLPAKLKLEQIRPLVAGSDEQIRQVDLYLGQCYERLGQFDEQLEANRRVLSDDPSSLAARVGAASALVAAGKTDEALAEFEVVAAAIPAARLPAIPQVWSPLLQLRVAHQMTRPAVDRDWTRVDALLEQLQAAPEVTQPQMALLRADVLLRKGETAAARELLEEAVSTAPDDGSLRSALTQITLREKGVEAAKTVLDAAPTNAASVPLLLLDAQLAVRAGNSDKQDRLAAIEAAAAKLDADDARQLLSGLAAVRMADGDGKQAERLWRAVAERAPDDLRVRTALFELARNEGDAEKTAELAAEIGRIAGPTSPEARLALAGEKVLRVRLSMRKKALAGRPELQLSDDERGLLDDARNLLIEAENDRPGWEAIQRTFAEVEGLRGDQTAAIEHLQRAVDLGPVNPGVVRQLVTLLYATNRLSEAQEALTKLGPEGLEGTERISAEMEMRAGKFDEAVAFAERSVSADSTNVDDLLWFGQLLGRSGKAERAEEVFERAVANGPTKPETWLTLFAHQFATNRRRQAQRTLDRAADALQEPQRSLVLAQSYEMMGDAAAAERAFDEAVAATPDALEVARARTSYLLRRGKIGPAREALEKMLEKGDGGTTASGAISWARRALAELVASRGGYRSLEKGLEILQQNAGPGGRLSPDDMVVQIALLAGRPEPASWRRAIEQLETLSRRQPLSIAQRLQLAELRDKTGRWEDCRSDLVALAASPAASPSLYAALIEKLLKHDDLSSARIWLSKLRGLQPEAPLTLALEAKLAIAEKDKATAVAAAKKLMPSFPVQPELVPQLRGIATLMEDLGFAKAADKILKELASRSPEGVVAYAEFLGRQKRPAEALTVLERSWDEIPLERLLQAGLLVVRSQGTAPAAEIKDTLDRWFTKARRADPESITIQLLLAEWRETVGDVGSVASIYREMLGRPGLEPVQAAIVANNLAFHLAQPETAAEALELVNRAIGELGPHPDLLDTRGVVLVAAGKATQALADLQEAVLAPSAAKFLHLALAQAEARQPKDAAQSLERARTLGMDPAQLPAADKTRLERLEKTLAEASQKVAGA